MTFVVVAAAVRFTRPPMHKQGKSDEARHLLTTVYNWFSEGFGTPVLDKAKRCSKSWRNEDWLA